MTVGPKNEREAVVFAVEALRVDFQVLLHKAMLEAKVTHQELARRLGVKGATIRELLEEKGNPRLTLLAKAFHALGRRINLKTEPTVDPATQPK